MSSKVCPKCNVTHGARKLVCECGHDFGCKRSGKHADGVPPPGVAHAFPWPEPGTWIFDMPKGMAPIRPPEDLPQGQLSASVVKEQISYEGLGFCIYSFIHADRIADERLRELWTRARMTMQEIVGYLDQMEWEV